MNNSIIFEGERLDDLQRGGLMIIQNPKFFCFGIDAVLLSDFAKAQNGEKVCDLCTGTGIVPILMSEKTEAGSFVGLELQKGCANMAQRSVIYNNLQGKVAIMEGDVRDCSFLKSSSFNVITANPPYFKAGSGVANKNNELLCARHETELTLDELCITASRLLKFRGRFYLIHRPSRLVDVCLALRSNRLEPKTMRFVESKRGKKPNLVLIEAVRSGGSELQVLPNLTVYNDDGSLTNEVMDMYYK